MLIMVFLVLVCILKDIGLDKIFLGILGLICVLVDDISVWCLLAIVIVVICMDNIFGVFFIFLGIIVYIVFMVILGRKFFKYIFCNYG